MKLSFTPKKYQAIMHIRTYNYTEALYSDGITANKHVNIFTYLKYGSNFIISGKLRQYVGPAASQYLSLFNVRC